MRRRILHYRMTDSLMIVGIIISFICFFNCMSLYHLLATQRVEAEAYQYESRWQGIYFNPGESLPLGDFLYAGQGIIRLRDVELYWDDVEAPGLTDVILSQKEALIYPVVEGRLPESDEGITEPTVILGRGHLEDALYEDGQWYYTLEGVKCRVCAVLGSENSDLFDYQILLYYRGSGDALQGRLDAWKEAVVCIESSHAEAQTVSEEVSQRLRGAETQASIGGGGSNLEAYRLGTERDSGYYLIIFLFCVVNVIIVSEYWVKKRFLEIAVRKVFGYSDARIFGVLYRDMAVNVSIAVGIAAVVQVILQCVFKDYLQVYRSQFVYYAAYSVLFIFVLSGIIMIYPFILLRKQEGMKRMVY